MAIWTQTLLTKKVLSRAHRAPMANQKDTNPTVAASTATKRMSRASQITLGSHAGIGLTPFSLPLFFSLVKDGLIIAQ